MKIFSSKSLYLFLVIISMVYVSADETVVVTRVIDGDTVVLKDSRRVRLLGVDTPELRYSSKMRKDMERTGRDAETLKVLAEKSKDFLEKLVLNKKVTLITDIHNAAKEHKDVYGRTLAYLKVYIKRPPEEIRKILDKTKSKWRKDEYMVNALLLQYGYAYAYTRAIYKWKDKFRDFEREARDNEYGLWGKVEGLKSAYNYEDSAGYYPYIASKNENSLHKRDCARGQHIFPKNILCFKRVDDALLEGFKKCEKCLKGQED